MVAASSTTTGAIIAGLLGVAAGPLVAYITASRKLSGKITTSDASDLWEESRATRKFLNDQLEKATARIETLEKRVDELEVLNADLVKENARALREIAALKEKLHA